MGRSHLVLLPWVVMLWSASDVGGLPRPSIASSARATPSGHATDLPPDLCKLFPPAEIGNLLGTPVDGGEVGGPMGTACVWSGTKDENAYALVQVIQDTGYWTNPKTAPGYEALGGVGEVAFSHPEEGGWRASALTREAVAVVVLSSSLATRRSAVTLLRQLLERL